MLTTSCSVMGANQPSRVISCLKRLELEVRWQRLGPEGVVRVWRGEGFYHLLSAFPPPASKAGESGRRLARLASLSENQHHMARHAVVVVVIETETRFPMPWKWWV